MSECSPLTFSNITPDKWKLLQAKAGENSIDLPGDAGEASRSGFTFRWQYDAAQATLTIQCVDHPFWAPCELINAKVSQLAESQLDF